MMDNQHHRECGVSEFELVCESCSGSLALTAVPAADGEGSAGERRIVAECVTCGNRYSGGSTLDAL